MKKALQILLNILIASAIVFGVSFILMFGTHTRIHTDIVNYSEDLHGIGSAERMMPGLESLSDYASLEYSYKIHCSSLFMGFVSDGYALCVTYDESRYDTKKAEALSSYTYLQEPVTDRDGDYIMPVTELTYKGYTLKVVPDEEQYTYCPCKSFMLIGFNDTERKIMYLYHFNYDLDYIAKHDEDPEAEMIELIEEVFAWVE